MNKKFLIIPAVGLVVILLGIFAYLKISAPLKIDGMEIQNNSKISLIKNGPDSVDGSVWITQNEKGILVNGTVEGNALRPRKLIDGISEYDHIEVWVSDGQEPKLPPIDWGNQFGNPVLNSESDCNPDKSDGISDVPACQKWYRDQVGFRLQFEKLFIREWQLTPVSVEEIYALPAYNSLPKYVEENLKTLKPTINPSIKITDGKHSYNFEIQIPWSALPPTPSLNLKNIKIMVDVVPSGEQGKYESYSSTSGKHTYGDLKALRVFQLPAPRQYSITSCGYDLGDNYDIPQHVFSDGAVAYMLPGDDLNINKTIMVDNVAQGYQYEPDASSTSPTIYDLHYFEKKVSPTETVCGPRLAYVKGSQVLKTETSVLPTGLEVSHISKDEVLVKSGPYAFNSYYGSGQCGGCTRGALTVNYLDLKNATSTEAYSFYSIFDFNDADFKISSDLKKIVQYDYGFLKSAVNPNDLDIYSWSSTNYCFSGKTHLYGECGKNASTTPPSPRIFSPILNGI